MSYFALKSSNVVIIWGLRPQIPESSAPIASGGRGFAPGPPPAKIYESVPEITYMKVLNVLAQLRAAVVLNKMKQNALWELCNV